MQGDGLYRRVIECAECESYGYCQTACSPGWYRSYLSVRGSYDHRATYLDHGCNSCIVGSRTIAFDAHRCSHCRDPREKRAGQPRATVT
jgi:hypothetical protein